MNNSVHTFSSLARALDLDPKELLDLRIDGDHLDPDGTGQVFGIQLGFGDSRDLDRRTHAAIDIIRRGGHDGPIAVFGPLPDRVGCDRLVLGQRTGS